METKTTQKKTAFETENIVIINELSGVLLFVSDNEKSYNANLKNVSIHIDKNTKTFSLIGSIKK